jgi:hypothetical protein
MNNARLKMGLSGLSVPAFLVKCRKIVTAITRIPRSFQTPFRSPTVRTFRSTSGFNR